MHHDVAPRRGLTLAFTALLLVTALTTVHAKDGSSGSLVTTADDSSGSPEIRDVTDSDQLVREVEDFGKKGGRVVLRLRVDRLDLRGVDFRNEENTKPGRFASGQLTLQGMPPHGERTVLDTAMRTGLIPVLRGSARLTLDRIIVVNMCESLQAIGFAQLSAVASGTAFLLRIFERTPLYASHTYLNLVAYGRMSDIKTWLYVGQMLKSPFPQLRERYLSMFSDVSEPWSQLSQINTTSFTASSWLPGARLVNVTLKAVTDPGDVLLAQLRAEGKLMPAQDCNGTLLPPEATTNQTNLAAGPIWLTSNRTADFVAGLQAAAAVSGSNNRSTLPPPAVMVAGQYRLTQDILPDVVDVCGPILFHGLDGSVLDLALRTNVLQLGVSGVLYASNVVIKGFVERAPPPILALPQPVHESAFPLSALAFPVKPDMWRAAPSVWLANSHLVLPPRDYIALVVLALGRGASDQGTCVTPEVATHAAQLQAHMYHLLLDSMDLGLQWLLLTNLTGWGVTARTLRVTPSEPLAPALAMACAAQLRTGGPGGDGAGFGPTPESETLEPPPSEKRETSAVVAGAVAGTAGLLMLAGAAYVLGQHYRKRRRTAGPAQPGCLGVGRKASASDASHSNLDGIPAVPLGSPPPGVKTGRVGSESSSTYTVRSNGHTSGGILVSECDPSGMLPAGPLSPCTARGGGQDTPSPLSSHPASPAAATATVPSLRRVVREAQRARRKQAGFTSELPAEVVSQRVSADGVGPERERADSRAAGPLGIVPNSISLQLVHAGSQHTASSNGSAQQQQQQQQAVPGSRGVSQPGHVTGSTDAQPSSLGLPRADVAGADVAVGGRALGAAQPSADSQGGAGADVAPPGVESGALHLTPPDPPLRVRAWAKRRPSIVDAGRVLIHGVLGSGSWGTVYTGEWRGLPVAIKTLVFTWTGTMRPGSRHPSSTGAHSGSTGGGSSRDGSAPPAGSDERRRVEAHAIMEAAIAASVQHPNLVATYVYDIKPVGPMHSASQDNGSLEIEEAFPHEPGLSRVGSTGATPMLPAPRVRDYKLYLVQELCGCSLAAALDARALAQDESGAPCQASVFSVLMDIARGLAYLHSKGIVHGDLKPDNVLLKVASTVPTGVIAKLADYGMSSHLGNGATHVSNFQGGTPFYVAPEVVRHHRTSPASDIYSLGIVMWQLWTGQPPYADDGHGQLVWSELFGRFDIAPTAPPPHYYDLYVRCLDPDPRARPTALEIISELLAMAPSVVPGGGAAWV